MSKYKVGDKFIVEIEETICGYGNNPNDTGHITEPLHRIKGFNTLVFDSYGLDKLQKYEDSEYAEGVKEGLNSFDCEVKKAYEKGLADAWELARKITSWTYSDRKKVLEFGYNSDAFVQYTYQEALAKVEAYEKSQQIQVGDVVIDLDGNERVVLHIEATGKAQIFSKGGVTRIHKEHLKKTGRHIDIEHLLEQIRGNE